MASPAIDLSAGMKPLQTAPPQSGGIDLSAGMVPTQPSAVSRFASNAASGAGVMPEQDAENFFKHPIDTAQRMLQAQGDLGARAGREIKSGDLVRGLTHGAEWLLPGVGPTLAKSGDQLESGDIAGGTGTAVGAALPLVAGSPEARGIASGKIAQSIGAVAKPFKVVAEDLPVVGSVIKGANAVKNVGGDLADIWGKKPPSPSAPATDPTAALWPPDSQTPGALADIPARSAQPAAQTGEALGTVKQPGQAGQLAASMQQPAPSADVSPGFKRGSLGDLLDKALGAEKPNVQPGKPIYQRTPTTPSPEATMTPSKSAPAADLGIPEGHTPVQSSWIKSYKYDPTTREFEMAPKSGTPVRLGDVSPEDAQAFADAKSQGKAWQQIKNNLLIAKRINGKWTPVKASGGAAP